jgi:hypothetical protein
MDAYQDLLTQLESMRGEILQTKDQRDELGDERGEALVSLAEHYLPTLTPEAIRQTWSEVRDSISQVLHRKQEHARRIQLVRDGLAARRQQQDGQLVALSTQLDQAVARQHALAEQVESQLRQDPQFASLSERAGVAEAALERAEANLQEIDQDAARKLPAYDGSPLFRYLHDRGYGTDKYAPRGLTRSMDRWLARYINYASAKKGYDFLRTTPEQMRQIIAADREALDIVLDELERRRDEVAGKLGLAEAIQHSAQLARQRDEQLQSLDLLLKETDQVQQELTDVDDPRGTYYRQAITLFQQMLEKHDSGDLQRQAAQTQPVTDDQIVARLQGVELEIGKLDEDARRRRSELDQRQWFLGELAKLLQRFRAAQFDSSRSQFVGSLDIRDEVRLAQEDRDIERLWKCIRSAQRWGSIAAQQSPAAPAPLAQLLVNAMTQATAGSPESHARRAGERRAERDASRPAGPTAAGGGNDSGAERS